MRRMFKRFYIILLLMIIAMTTVAYSQYKYAERIVKNEVQTITNLSLINLETEINNWMLDKSRVIEDVADFIGLNSWNDEEILSYLSNKLRNHSSFKSFYYGKADNQMINGSGWTPPEGFILTDRPWYIEAKEKNDLIITDVFINASNDDAIVTIAKPVRSDNGVLLGVVGGDISINTVINIVNEYKLGNDGLSFLVSSKGQLLAHPKLTDIEILDVPEETDQYVPLSLINFIIEDKYGLKKFDFNGVEGYLAYMPIATIDWFLASFISLEEIYASSQQLTLGFLLVITLSMGIFLIFLMLQRKYIVSPLVELESSVSAINIEKDLTYRIKYKDRSETKTLSEIINQLLSKIESFVIQIKNDQEELQAMNEELEASVEQMMAAEEEIMRQKTQFEALFKNSIDAIVMFNKEHLIIDINTSFTNLYGYTLNEIYGKELDGVLSATEKKKEANKLTKNLLSGKEVSLESIRYGKGGIPINVSIKGVPILYGNTVVGGYGIYTDISERKRAEEEIIYVSYHDRLTGLFNRSYFEEALVKVENEKKLPISIIIGDVNGLKMTNDAFGHEVGDIILKNISEILLRVCGDKGIVSRIGGDEFAVILPNTDEVEGLSICNNIKKSCEADSKGTIQLSVSLGVATKNSMDDNIQDVCKLAEDRMYDNKLLESKSIRNSIISSLRKTLEERTHETDEHSSRMMEMSLRLGKKLGLNENQLNELRLLAALHDIGKIAIPDHILVKSGPLTSEEWLIMKKHCEIGYRIASASAELAIIAEAILHHHERWDGGGYPQGLKGEEITLSARVIAVVDAYDAMTSDRPYRKAMDQANAIEELIREKGKQFDPQIVDMFLTMLQVE